jgi:aldehyde dehydrogenase (NAD+)
MQSENPSDTRETVALFAPAGCPEVDDALDAATRAQRIWASSGIERRQRVLDAIGRELMVRADEIGELLAREEGKTRSEAVGEVVRAGQFFVWFAGEALRVTGDTVDSVRPGVGVSITREPVGVVAIISPWNFPIATASWKIAPALAFGNAVVWKPASLTPATAQALARIIAAQDLPPGLFNLIVGPGETVGAALVDHPGVAAVSFTGSHATGLELARRASGRFVRLQLELGAKNALVVMDDADIEAAADAAIFSAYSGSGQKCTAASRLVVHDCVHDAFIGALIRRLKTFRVGHALDPESRMGPVASAGQLAGCLRWLEIAEAEGCERIWGGELLERPTPGHYISPALLVGGSNAMRINREEVFSPLSCVIRMADLEEALSITNDTIYGLTAAIFTRSLTAAEHFRRHAEVGCVMVNLPTAGTDYHVPFGGRKASGFGPREQGRNAVEFFTEIKTSYLAAGEYASARRTS